MVSGFVEDGRRQLQARVRQLRLRKFSCGSRKPISGPCLGVEERLDAAFDCTLVACVAPLLLGRMILSALPAQMSRQLVGHLKALLVMRSWSHDESTLRRKYIENENVSLGRRLGFGYQGGSAIVEAFEEHAIVRSVCQAHRPPHMIRIATRWPGHLATEGQRVRHLMVEVLP